MSKEKIHNMLEWMGNESRGRNTKERKCLKIETLLTWEMPLMGWSVNYTQNKKKNQWAWKWVNGNFRNWNLMRKKEEWKK